ncbi:nuclease-related domain-containing protein [Anaerobacillus alkaliphilus]|nr:nuclease-related domain-containing protein [Anaerobacillus alkaliphilus]
MIDKERKIPYKVMVLEVLLARLSVHYPNRGYIEGELGKAIAGWRGEQAIDYYLTFLPKEKYRILHDLRLEDNEKRFFQIDTILLSKKYHVILEVKNMAGTLFFNNNPQQLVQTLNNEEKAYQCPIMQVERQRLQLQAFLRSLQLPEVPIFVLVVSSHPNTVIKIAPNFKKANQYVIQSAAIPERINTIEANFDEDKLTPKELKKISRTLIKHHQPLKPDYLEKYKIAHSDLLTGVHCPNCRQIPMQRKRGYWYCHSCQHSSKDAHLAAIHNYSVLLGPTITNQQLRNFLHLPSPSVASKILSSLSLKKSGIMKGSYYQLE